MSIKKSSKSDALLEELLETIKSAKKFTKEHAPDIAREMIEEEKFKQKFCLTMAFIAFTLSIVGLLYSLFGPEPNSWNITTVLSASRIAIGIASLPALIISIGIGAESFLKLKLLIIAPKAFLLERIRSI